MRIAATHYGERAGRLGRRSSGHEGVIHEQLLIRLNRLGRIRESPEGIGKDH